MTYLDEELLENFIDIADGYDVWLCLTEFASFKDFGELILDGLTIEKVIEHNLNNNPKFRSAMSTELTMAQDELNSRRGLYNAKRKKKNQNSSRSPRVFSIREALRTIKNSGDTLDG